LNVIRDTMKKYGEDNFYLSFSGGKDSTVIHHLLDMALPGNKIPRVYANTGIEYLAIVDFVKELQKEDDRFIILKPTKNIKQTLERVGYPFKSKEYSQQLYRYQTHQELIDPYIQEVKQNPELAYSYEYISTLPAYVKSAIKEYFGVRERERERSVPVCWVSLKSSSINLAQSSL